MDIPLCEIRIDKEGTWYFRGAEMFRKDIVNLFYQKLTVDEQGRYLIEMEHERCYLEVEDTPFVITAVHRPDGSGKGQEEIVLVLVDESSENLNPETLYVGEDNVLYCSIRGGRFKARFSRASYYQIASYFDYDDAGDLYYLTLNGRQYAIGGYPTAHE